ncbi:MAG: iron ABC transporter permease [Deltaproteobacteria bacterium]|nr:iron ABC transporter permease [Deltaproteobacteria bacterium]
MPAHREPPPPLTRARLVRVLVVAALALVVAALVAPLVGSADVDLRAVLRGDAPLDRAILLSARLPRVLAAILAGGTLAVVGVTMQAILRNALAEPYTLGVSGGGALAAALAIALGIDAVLPLGMTLPISSMLGSMSAMLLVERLASRHGAFSPGVLLLAGVGIGVVASAGILLALHVADPLPGARVLRWLMGGIDIGSPDLLWCSGPIAIVAVGVLVGRARDMNLLSAGDDTAGSLGVDVARTTRSLYLVASLATGAVVAIVGPIGFVGLVVPHALRRVIGADHRLLAPASALAGATFLLVCDTATRVAFAAREPPVGVVTALIGGPALLVLLLRERRATLL